MRIARFILSLLLAAGILAIPIPSQAQVAVGISVRIGPPVLPVYAQPICPGPDYIWVPGYWAYGDDDYFWSRAPGCLPLNQACFGRQATGAGTTVSTCGTPGIGDREWA